MKLSVVAALVMSSALFACGKKEEPPLVAAEVKPEKAKVDAVQVLSTDFSGNPTLVVMEFTPVTDPTMKCIISVTPSNVVSGPITCWKKAPGPQLPQ